MNTRRKTLLKNAQKIGCNTIVAFEPENLFYLTGFWGESIGLLEDDGKTTIIAPELELERAREESTNCEVIASERGTALISKLMNQIKGKKVCTDCQNYKIIQSMRKCRLRIKPHNQPFHESRIIKDLSEISILKKASKIIDNMFSLCVNKIMKGQKESELQGILMSYAIENEMFDTGYKSTLNPLIVAGGPNSSFPHSQVTKRKFRNGDLIVIDLTLRYKGYVSDATRTFALGKISDEAKKVYEIVKESQKLGLNSIKPNIFCSKVDKTCRQFIKEKGYENFFIHATGHGIGLEVHELPSVSDKSKTKLKKNMAITVEPGIYLPNKFGVRIEDSLIVKEKPMILHKFSKNLITI